MFTCTRTFRKNDNLEEWSGAPCAAGLYHEIGTTLFLKNVVGLPQAGILANMERQCGCRASYWRVMRLSSHLVTATTFRIVILPKGPRAGKSCLSVSVGLDLLQEVTVDQHSHTLLKVHSQSLNY